jgi:IPT/TIG domain/Bacterial Ig-like domain (group 2)
MRYSWIELVVRLLAAVTLASSLFIFQTCASAQDHANRNDNRAKDPTPDITSLSASTGSTGTYVTIEGTNFGSTQGSSTVAFNGVAARPITWSSTSIVARVPDGAATGKVVVTVHELSSNAVPFTAVPAALQITSPVSGTIVKPGQSFALSVASPNSTAFAAVVVVAEDPFGFSALQAGVPGQVAFTVPAQTACRPYTFTAMGRTASGQTVDSVPILIDVERPDLPTLVSTQTSELLMSAPGEEAPLIVLATFADGFALDVTHSTKVAYSSTDSSVATIDENGIVTAVSPGRVFVTADYTTAGKRIPTAIPVSVPTPTLTPSKFAVTFLSQAVGTASSSQSLTLTNMANAPVRVISLHTTGDFSESDNCRSLSPLPAGGKCVVNVTFKPSAVGTRPGKLLIVNSSDGVPSILPLAGSGIRP